MVREKEKEKLSVRRLTFWCGQGLGVVLVGWRNQSHKYDSGLTLYYVSGYDPLYHVLLHQPFSTVRSFIVLFFTITDDDLECARI